MELNEITDGLSEPVRKAWIRSLTNGRAAMTRRMLLRATALAAGAGSLAACGIPPAKSSSTGSNDAPANSAKDLSDSEKVVNFSNWPLYIDVDEKDKEKHGTLDEFAAATGIKVKYTEDINDNVEFFGKVKPQLAAGQDTGRDLMVLTDWMAGRLIRLGWAQKLDAANVTNAITNLESRFRAPDWDPGRQYSYPWAGIQVVVAYNKKATKGKAVTSVSQLLDDPELKGRVTFLSEMRDTIGMTLLDMGKDPAKFTADDYNAAIARLQKAVDSKQIRKFTGNDYGQELSSGDIAACVAWGGDLIQLKADNPDIEFVIPEAGYVASTDNMLIPAKAQHKKNAELLINFYYQPKAAAELTAGINYVSPVVGVKDELAKLAPDVAANPLVIPSPEMAAKVHVFRSLTEAEETEFEDKFSKLIGA
ncbi:spermidine/putrescine ABC transporter substrate-binding protein [Kitasatospora atroaurantiaca]|uniref:Spermidine/putrescine transport system substrate-binding protein n=1 Tax=Kitasatospora atroaurantiaca TaxID=285545 RepID=A0A561EVX8_9ACTN|nr:spermidine/putrescine ABC transporter substrate-binding protein [Kitasatospora atroaurantiaca]TWE19762.1 spermidine/putrescine transport system substrate-binding protein [Kitasatospora atroaurantiaca]